MSENKMTHFATFATQSDSFSLSFFNTPCVMEEPITTEALRALEQQITEKNKFNKALLLNLIPYNTGTDSDASVKITCQNFNCINHAGDSVFCHRKRIWIDRAGHCKNAKQKEQKQVIQ